MLDDETILITDYNNKLKRLDSTYIVKDYFKIPDSKYRVKDCCKLSSYPWAVCDVGQGRVLFYKTIKLVNVGDTSLLM